MFEYFYRESSVDKIYLAPHALPHFRHKICEYGAYNIGEQKLIADFALKEFGIKTLPMPKDSIVTTNKGCALEKHINPTLTIIMRLLCTINQF